MMLKLRNWKVKMSIMKERELRDKLFQKGVRVSGDLTRQQSAVVAQAKRENRECYFVRGVMTMVKKRTEQSRQQQNRSYADITAQTLTKQLTNTQDRTSLTGRGCDSVGSFNGKSPYFATSSDCASTPVNDHL